MFQAAACTNILDLEEAFAVDLPSPGFLLEEIYCAN